MKKIFTVLMMVLSVSVFADWAYKNTNGKISPLKTITAGESSAYQGQGFTVTADRLALYNLLVSTGQEQAAIDRGIIPTAAEKILAQSKFLKLEITRAMRSNVISQTRTASLIYGEPDIVTNTVTQEDVLDAILDASPIMKKDWNNATIIDLADPLVIQALGAGNIDVSAVKLKILTLQK